MDSKCLCEREHACNSMHNVPPHILDPTKCEHIVTVKHLSTF